VFVAQNRPLDGFADLRSDASHGPAKAALKQLYLPVRSSYTPAMRPEIARAVDEIQQAIALLRRHL
jgi:hypothetical protein